MRNLYNNIADKTLSILSLSRARKALAAAALALIALAAVPSASALPADTYAASSRLASGRWIKVSVTGSGMHKISDESLRAWGLNPAKTKIYGYGARRLPEELNSGYLDDLPQTPSEYVGGRGLFFYAEGPRTFTLRNGNYATPVNNPFTDLGYYYLSDSGSDERLAPGESGSAYAPTEQSPSTFYDRAVHEVDLYSPGNVGFFLTGEDFRYKPAQTFTLNLSNPDESQPALVEVSFVAHTVNAGGRISVGVNGTTLPSTASDNFTQVTDVHTFGREILTRKQAPFKGSRLNVEIRFSASGSVTRANLNYICVSYARKLQLGSGKCLSFTLANARPTLGGASDATRIWDVTDPLEATAVRHQVSGGFAGWQSSYAGATRRYAAWEPSGSFPSPQMVEEVASQNIHAKDVPDMVIFTPAEWRTEAERLARMHRTDATDPLDVLVLTPRQVYNEFSSGSPDAQAFRKVLKMFYDRGQSAPSGKRLRYAMFFSRPTFDPRLKTEVVRSLGYTMLPAWFSDSGLNENDAYTTDDIFGFLEDGSGVNQSRDKLSIAVGRIPAVSIAEAKAAVDKIAYYSSRLPKGNWKNNLLILADDQDNGDHMTQANTMAAALEGSDSGSDIFLRKVYLDEFELVANRYPEAKTQLFRLLDEGVAFWSFQGHGAPTSLTHEQVVTYQELNSFDLRHWPVMYAATCDFMKWDSPTRSGAEMLFNNPNGGVIGAISATRPAYISQNGELSAAVGRNMFTRDDRGLIVPLGEGYRLSKNDYRNSEGTPVSNANKLRYVLLGDPAMRMIFPSNRIVLDEMGGRPVVSLDAEEEPATLMARQTTTAKGRVVDPLTGATLTGFNGTLSAVLYDAEESVTTRGNGKEGTPVTFDRQGSRLFVGSAKIVNGEFTMQINMPAEVADNYRRAAFNLYAQGTIANKTAEAASLCRDFYVYGEDENARPDNQPPVVEQIYLNHPSFENGQEVNPNPVLIARVSDNLGINLSQAGVGHAMTISLDQGDKTFADVADFFTPFADGRPGGTIAYPLTNLSEGYHSLTLRVWDNQPNSATATVECFVSNAVAPNLYDVYTETNPVQDVAKFYVTHDRPDRSVTVTIDVYDLMGRRLWTATESGRSDMFTSMAISWDLLDSGGRRVPRGIYVYRATITDADSGEKSSTASKKLAVKGI